MKGCGACFTSGGPIQLTAEEPSFGDCNFCGEHGTKVWDVVVWADHFARLLDMYDPTDDPEIGRALEVRVQDDWRLFSFGDTAIVRTFLEASLEPVGHQLLSDGVLVVPRYEEDGAAADHKTKWDAFRHELIAVNRYFPAADFDRDFFRDLVLGRQEVLSEGMRLFRGRVSSSPTAFGADAMGVPPANLVTGGRGNPVGIAHLYLAGDVDTCLKECRAQFNGFVSVAEFKIARPLRFLDLADLVPENPFLVGDSDADEPNALVRSLVSTQFLNELGRELAVPTRPGENQIEYVPTQYLCEFVKSLGVDGIRYNSSLHSGGWNIVLFDLAGAEVVEPVRLFEVIEMNLDFRERSVSALPHN